MISLEDVMVLKKDEIITVLDRLEEEYPDAQCALDFRNLFELIIAVVLSAQTTDVSVNKASPKLFQKYGTPQLLAAADPKEVEPFIKTIGMYRTKSKNIVNLARMLVSDYDGQVPDNYDDLIKLPGVGRKTANVVLSVGYGQARIAVDTHVFRLANRIGFVRQKDVLKTELGLMKKIPKERWSTAHHCLIFHGRQCCTARKPACHRCVIEDLCKKNSL